MCVSVHVCFHRRPSVSGAQCLLHHCILVPGPRVVAGPAEVLPARGCASGPRRYRVSLCSGSAGSPFCIGSVAAGGGFPLNCLLVYECLRGPRHALCHCMFLQNLTGSKPAPSFYLSLLPPPTSSSSPNSTPFPFLFKIFPFLPPLASRP